MNRKFLLLCTTLALSVPVLAGLPEALLNFKYDQYAAALKEFQALATQGNPPAFYYLGRMYQNGWGVQKNIPQALKYFQVANQSFYLPAAAQIGKILLHGEGGIAADPKNAIPYLKTAALGGSSEAAFELGNAMKDGLTGDVNFNHAFGYYSIAALKGNYQAQFELGQMYMAGRGVPQDFKKALMWLSRSANQGFVKAQRQLAYEYENNAKLKNLGRAYAWNSILAAYNSDDLGASAAQKRDELATQIPTENLSEQQAAIRAWTPRTPAQSVPLEERLQPPPIIPDFNDSKTLQQILLQEGALPQDAALFDITMEDIDIAEATGDYVSLTNAVEKKMKEGHITVAAFYGDLLNKRFHNPTEAIKWYETGAKAEDPYAQYQLAKSYCSGDGEVPNSPKCYAWLLIASETQDPVLNTPIQQALVAVRANATPQELEQGQALYDEMKNKGVDQSKEKGFLDFF